MTEIKHFSSKTDAQTIAEVLSEDGALIIDNVVSSDFIAELRSETDPYMNHTSNGEDPFAGFNTTRTGGLLIRSEKCRELIEHSTILEP